MLQNYFSTSDKFNCIRFFTIILISIFFGEQTYSQCATPIVGCSGTDLSNFGVDSNNNASTIEYDNYVSSFHTTVVRTASGSLQVWGENSGRDGTTHLTTPTIINSANFTTTAGTIYELTGTPLKAA